MIRHKLKYKSAIMFHIHVAYINKTSLLSHFACRVMYFKLVC